MSRNCPRRSSGLLGPRLESQRADFRSDRTLNISQDNINRNSSENYGALSENLGVPMAERSKTCTFDLQRPRQEEAVVTITRVVHSTALCSRGQRMAQLRRHCAVEHRGTTPDTMLRLVSTTILNVYLLCYSGGTLYTRCMSKTYPKNEKTLSYVKCTPPMVIQKHAVHSPNMLYARRGSKTCTKNERTYHMLNLYLPSCSGNMFYARRGSKTCTKNERNLSHVKSISPILLRKHVLRSPFVCCGGSKTNMLYARRGSKTCTKNERNLSHVKSISSILLRKHVFRSPNSHHMLRRTQRVGSYRPTVPSRGPERGSRGAKLTFYSYLPYAVAPRYQVPGPYVYSTGNAVYQSVEPVEEHGYKIVY
ncbi:hypothetical protein J6590_053635 [Homalodisca vitripennis]|nr:hypothetical protein J6590_053635 [Homalodisca vitripennis]